MLALEFADPGEYRRVEQGDVLVLEGLRDTIGADTETRCALHPDERYVTRHRLSDRQVAMLLAGGLLSWLREQNEEPTT